MLSKYEILLFGILSIADNVESIQDNLFTTNYIQHSSSDSTFDISDYENIPVIEVENINSLTFVNVLEGCINLAIETKNSMNTADSLELEIRFGRIVGTRFIPGIDEAIYRSLIDFYKIKSDVIVECKTKDVIMENITNHNSSIRITTEYLSNEDICISKQKLYQYTFKLRKSSMSIRISISVEQRSDPKYGGKTKLVREKNRLSVIGNAIDIDLTKVSTSGFDTYQYNEEIIYELELEVSKNFWKDTEGIYKHLDLVDILFEELEWVLNACSI